MERIQHVRCDMAKGKRLLVGAANPKGKGEVVAIVRVVNGDDTKIAKVLPGEALVGEKFFPQHNDYLKKATALITEVGGPGSHAGMMGKIYGITTVCGTETATKLLKDGQKVIVNGISGEIFEYIDEGEAPKPQPAGGTLAERMAARKANK